MPWKAQQSAIVALLQFLKNSKDAEPPPLVKYGPILWYAYISVIVYTTIRIYDLSYIRKNKYIKCIVTYRYTSSHFVTFKSRGCRYNSNCSKWIRKETVNLAKWQNVANPLIVTLLSHSTILSNFGVKNGKRQICWNRWNRRIYRNR